MGLTVDDLALASQLETEALDQLEGGQVPLDPASLLRVSLALEIAPKELFGDSVAGDVLAQRTVKHTDVAFAIHGAVLGSYLDRAARRGPQTQASTGETWWMDRGRWIPRHAVASNSEVSELFAQGAIATKSSPESIWLCWDVETVDDVSLESALEYLHSLESHRRVIFKFRKAAWARERFASPQAAIMRMEQLASFRRVEVARLTSIRRLELSEVNRAHPLLRHAMEAWLRDGEETFWPTAAPADWALVFERKRDALVFSHIGRQSEAMRRLGAVWRRRAFGATSHNGFVDDEFNRRADEAYWIAVEEKVPVLDHVLAHIRTQEDADWLPYQRLTLPTRNGVAVFTKVTPNISIPLLGRAA